MGRATLAAVVLLALPLFSADERKPAAVMGYQGADWLEREGREAEQRPAEVTETEKGRLTGRVVKATTVADLCEFVGNDYVEKERRSKGRLEKSLVHVKAHFGEDTKARLVDSASISVKAKRKVEGAANGTINRELAALRRGFRLA